MTVPEAVAGMPRPRFDPTSALGWNDIALDGLSCYLRCVESWLALLGYDPEALVWALAGPVDLLRRRRTGSTYDHCHVEWQFANDGRDNWAFVADRLERTEPVIIMPDRYYWPDDEFEGEEHFHDHMVLAFALQRDALFVLDTDAPPDDEFVREFEVDESVMRACTRIGLLHAAPPLPHAAGAEQRDELLRMSVDLLATDIAVLRRFLATWDGRTMPYLLARGFHVAVLGDFQPVLFIFAQALSGDERPEVQAVRGAASAAAAGSKRLGLLLLAQHRYRSDRVYGMCREAFARLIEMLDALLGRLCAAVQLPMPDAPEPVDDFRSRLADVTELCFDPGGTVTRRGAILPGIF